MTEMQVVVTVVSLLILVPLFRAIYRWQRDKRDAGYGLFERRLSPRNRRLMIEDMRQYHKLCEKTGEDPGIHPDKLTAEELDEVLIRRAKTLGKPTPQNMWKAGDKTDG